MTSSTPSVLNNLSPDMSFKKCNRKWVGNVSGMWVLLKCEWNVGSITKNEKKCVKGNKFLGMD